MKDTTKRVVERIHLPNMRDWQEDTVLSGIIVDLLKLEGHIHETMKVNTLAALLQDTQVEKIDTDMNEADMKIVVETRKEETIIIEKTGVDMTIVLSPNVEKSIERRIELNNPKKKYKRRMIKRTKLLQNH